MPLTQAQINNFFTEDDQMGIPQATVDRMQQEGIDNVSDLAEFDKESLQLVTDNLRKPGGRIPDPDPNAVPGATIPTPPFIFGAKSQKRLLVATDLVKYYQTTGRELTAANIRWFNVMKNFELQWKALKAKQAGDVPDTPKITKSLPVIKWAESFKDFLSRVIGVRTIPLSYIIRENVEVPADAPNLANHQPHATEFGSVEAEMVARASHTHALYRDDNSSVYHHLEEATRTTIYAASIKPFQRGKDGRGAWLALVRQYAGKDKWEAEIEKQDALLHDRVWKGQSNFSLESFISQHRNAFVSMQACAEHVQYQLPTEFTRVGYLLNAIKNSDPGLQAGMANVKSDTGDDGMRNNFEAAAAYLLPYDPVAKKRAANGKSRGGQISSTDGEETADVGAVGSSSKPSIGKTGVHFRFYKEHEYRKLSNAQKKELMEWRESNPTHGSSAGSNSTGSQRKSPGGKRKHFNRQISSLVDKRVKFCLGKNTEKEAEVEESKAYIESVVKAVMNTQQNQSATASAATAARPPTPPTNLKSILHRARAGKP